jgi:3-oxoacyl-[acyl-carrier-protein] synthase II
VITNASQPNPSLPTGADGRRVVITGFGPITASGIGRDALWEGLRGERSPIRKLDRFDASAFKCRLAAQVDGFEPKDWLDATQARRLDRFGQFALVATSLALSDAGLKSDELQPDRVAVQMGSALGGVAYAEEQLGGFLKDGVRAVNPRLALLVFGGAASCNVAINFGFTGPNSTNAMSCASGTMAVGEAWRHIKDGSADAAIAGGVEAPLAQLSYGAFAIIRAMSTRNDDPTHACRPFDGDRDGFVMGEGAGVLVLEELEHAKARGARIYAELLGYGNTNDAHHMTAPRPDGSQAARAIKMALDRGGVRPEEIDYVNAHGSSTLLNDSTESKAITVALGARASEIPVTGTKPYYGHALGASGAIEVGICSMVLEQGWIPPTLNHEAPGDGCELDYVANVGRTSQVNTILSNSFGFGGINASVVLRRYVDETVA